MSLLDTLRGAVTIANKVTRPIQATVTLAHTIGRSGSGTISHRAPVTLSAIVDWKQKQLRTADGILSVSRASVMFLDPVALARATNNEGVDDLDIIVLPDGTTGPILDMSGFIDAGTTQPLATEVFLG